MLTNLSLQVFAAKYVADEDEIEILEVVASKELVQLKEAVGEDEDEIEILEVQEPEQRLGGGVGTALSQPEEPEQEGRLENEQEQKEQDAQLDALFSEQRADLDAEIDSLNGELQAARAAEKLSAEGGDGGDSVYKEEPAPWVDCHPDQLYDVLGVDPVPSDAAIEKGLQDWDQLAEVFNNV